MIVQLFDENDGTIGAPMQIVDMRLRNAHRRHLLQPGQIYWVRLYAVADEPIYQWRPIRCDDIAVLDTTIKPATQGSEPPLPPGATRLLLRVRFEVFNDGPWRKVVRWGFQAFDADGDNDPTTFHTCRLAFDIKPTNRRIIFAIGSSVFLVFAANGSMDIAAAYFANVEPDANQAIWLLTVLGLSAIFTLIAGMLIYFFNRGWFFTSKR